MKGTRLRRPRGKQLGLRASPLPQPRRESPLQQQDFGRLEILKVIKTFPIFMVNETPLADLAEPVEQVVATLRSPDSPTHDPVVLAMALQPLDPDFPFNVLWLYFTLTVPHSYLLLLRSGDPSKRRPTIRVHNEDIPRGFAVNVERGFGAIVDVAFGKTASSEFGDLQLVLGKGLVLMLRTLDRYLERFLAAEKKATMKIVKFKKTPGPAEVPSAAPAAAPATPAPKAASRKTKPAATRPEVSPEVSAARAAAVLHLTTRLGKSLRLFLESPLELVYTFRLPGRLIPADASSTNPAPQRPHPPVAWRRGVLVRFGIPADYGASSPLRLEFDKSASTIPASTAPAGSTSQEINAHTARTLAERREVETAVRQCVANFHAYACTNHTRTLTEQVNYLTQHLGWFCAPHERFLEWRALSLEMAQAT